MKIFPKGRRFGSDHFYSPILIFAPGNELGGIPVAERRARPSGN
jgi:hypothetical protein